MIAAKALKRQRMLQFSSRTMTYDHREVLILRAKVKRKLSVMRQAEDLKEFNYQPPQMYYDRKTGEIKIKEKQEEKKKKLIRNIDDMEQEKEKLMREIAFDNEGQPLNENESID